MAGKRAAALLIAAAGLGLVGALIAWPSDPDPAETDPLVVGRSAEAGTTLVTVGMTDRLTFEPKAISMQAGETVTWKNTSQLIHTVTADASKAGKPSSVELPEGATPFDSGTMQPGATFSHTFDTPGTYRYFCIPHQGANMVGTVTVR